MNSMGYNIWKVFSTKNKHKKFNRPEVVGCSDYVPYNIFIKIFFESQGYGIQDNVLYQDIFNDNLTITDDRKIYLREIYRYIDRLQKERKRLEKKRREWRD